MGNLPASAAGSPAVSVIIACRNHAETLPAALESLVGQEFDRPWEIVFADNGSTDGSRAVFEAFMARHPAIAARVLDVPRPGKPHALNAAMRAARGQALLFCDADDTVAPGWLAAMGAALEEHPFVAARMDVTTLNPGWAQEERRNPQDDQLPRLVHAPYCTVAGGATLGFRREVLAAVGDVDPAFACLEDTDFCIRAHLAGFELRLVPDAVYNYRYRERPEDIYRQAFAYARYRALLRRRYAARRFPALSAWASLAWRLTRSALVRGADLVRPCATPLARARRSRHAGRAMGDLAGAIGFRVAPPPPAPSRRPALWHRVLAPAFGTLTAVRTSEKLLALTFDDGPDPASTPAVLEALARNGMRGTFFLIGRRAARHPELVERILAEGHEIGNHSWDHPALPLVSSRDVVEQLRRTRAVLPPGSGDALMRPPYGAQNLRTHLLARGQGYRVVAWSASGDDWRADDAATLADRIVATAAPGAIVLLHDSLYTFEDERYRDRSATVGALDLLARRLPDHRFVTVSELLARGRPRWRYWARATARNELAALGRAEVATPGPAEEMPAT